MHVGIEPTRQPSHTYHRRKRHDSRNLRVLVSQNIWLRLEGLARPTCVCIPMWIVAHKKTWVVHEATVIQTRVISLSKGGFTNPITKSNIHGHYGNRTRASGLTSRCCYHYTKQPFWKYSESILKVFFSDSSHEGDFSTCFQTLLSRVMTANSRYSVLFLRGFAPLLLRKSPHILSTRRRYSNICRRLSVPNSWFIRPRMTKV